MGPQLAQPLVQRLLALSQRADRAERLLEESRRAFERTRDQAALATVRERTQRALDAEIEFETVWNESAAQLFR